MGSRVGRSWHTKMREKRTVVLLCGIVDSTGPGIAQKLSLDADSAT